ncbi:MAG: hypothetical protein EOO50_12170 [Flavobacterium sp.]|uniref:hypothetical protein n=1 Tax=Flavobacterium sp. TaxID=239 RepID=UPI001229559E|nr:hypothetical protein [Flavobacterium sp.]RZJ65869.1 MAG: hypothetical protein EOO50_12170 [Flavobacterium sp.]
MFSIVVVILLLPVASQLILGSFSIAGRVKTPYAAITRVNAIFEIALLVAAPKMLDVEAKIEHVRSLMPHTTFFTLAIFLFLTFLGIVACQLVWKKGEKRRLKKQRQSN